MIAANSLLDPDSALFAGLPLFHVNALVVTLLAPLLRGQHSVWAGPLGYREPALFKVIWKIVEHFRIATMSAVPTVYAGLARVPLGADITSLRFAIVGASPLPSAVRAAFEDHTGVPLCQGYGLTEATCGSARSFLREHQRPEAAGQRMPYQQVKTVRIDSDGPLATERLAAAVGNVPELLDGRMYQLSGPETPGPWRRRTPTLMFRRSLLVGVRRAASRSSEPPRGKGLSRHQITGRHGWSHDVDGTRQQDDPSADCSFCTAEQAGERGRGRSHPGGTKDASATTGVDRPDPPSGRRPG